VGVISSLLKLTDSPPPISNAVTCGPTSCANAATFLIASTMMRRLRPCDPVCTCTIFKNVCC
jgi:hypothetical protein